MPFNKDLYEGTEANTGFLEIEPGIYVCKILGVEDTEATQLLKLSLISLMVNSRTIIKVRKSIWKLSFRRFHIPFI